MKGPERLTLSVLPGIPLLQPGDDLGAIIIEAIGKAGLTPRNDDVLVVAQKAVSKAQGRYVDLASITPSTRAKEIAGIVGKDPRLVEVILGESSRVVRSAPNVLIVEHRQGDIMANAGVDHSNVPPSAGSEPVLLLPEDPDASAEALRAKIEKHFGVRLGVIINDSFGRPWRRGTVSVALGAAGIPALNNLRGEPDLYGHPLMVSETALADELAAAASVLMGQADEGHPVVLISGLPAAKDVVPARALLRPASEDLFRGPPADTCSRCPAASAAPSLRSVLRACCRRAR
jgi:coenzyme F420-0:L-glutamate ligase/coenzyme F420-1:gamma-L-glutamate ligase